MADFFTNDVNRSCRGTKHCLVDRVDRATRLGLVSPKQNSQLSTHPYLRSCSFSSALSMVSIYEAVMERNPCTEWLP